MIKFTPIEEHMQLSREERRAHLKLDEPCMKIGGSGSSEFKGVLAHFLKTTIPTKIRTIYLCHACNDELCSNPEHLYWGTPKDNHQDKVECGRYKSIYQLMVEKHGVEETKRLMRERQLK